MQTQQTKNSEDNLPSINKLSSQIYKKRFWEDPTFLFICMGVLTISAMIATYFISQRYDNPVVVITSVAIVAMTITLFGGILIKTIAKLAELNNMKTDFVSIASHQLRTPLSVIKWYTEFLSREEKQQNLTDEQKKYIRIIDSSNQRMIRLVNDLLDISRIESGKIKIHPEPSNLIELIQNIIQENKILADKKDIKINFKYEQNIPLINMDPKRISMVVENLLSNAIKYMRDNEKEKVISIELSKDEKQILFSLADNGVGIPTKEQNKIFKKFFRANNTMKLQTSGTGLGLFIAKAIIESHGGKIWFVSKENIGTTFYFSLPLKQLRV